VVLVGFLEQGVEGGELAFAHALRHGEDHPAAGDGRGADADRFEATHAPALQAVVGVVGDEPYAAGDQDLLKAPLFAIERRRVTAEALRAGDLPKRFAVRGSTAIRNDFISS